MRFKLFSLVIVFLAVSLFGQEAKVPDAAKDALAKLYPKAMDVKWSLERKTEFEANFTDKKIPTSVVLNAKGKLLETEIDIAVTELSKNIQSYIQKNFAGYKISEAAKIVDPKGKITFEAEITKDKIKKDLLFDKNGKPVVKKETKKEKNEKEVKEENEKD